MNVRTLTVCALLLVALAPGCSRAPTPTPAPPQATLSPGSPGPPAPNISGLWDAAVSGNSNFAIPFRFEIAQDKVNVGRVDGFFFEGDRKVGSTSGTFENGALKLVYDFLNTTLEATLEGGELRGTYRNKSPNARPRQFYAQRFVPAPAPDGEVPHVEGNWAMYPSADDGSKLDVSWRLYLRQSGPDVSGAILKTSGDTGTLSGRWKDGRLVMSHFSGERPLIFEARQNADGTLSVTLDRTSTYRAARTNEARARGIPEPPDLSRFTSVKDPAERFHFSGSDLDGKIVGDTDPHFVGRVVVLTIGGTWCANCHDEVPFLVELYREFHAKGLEVAGLFFENDATLSVARPPVLSFISRYGVEFPIFVAGTNDVADVAARLPQLVNFAVFPTTIVLGRDGRVRRVHAGFASAATGAEHVRLTRETHDLIARLLKEPGPV